MSAICCESYERFCAQLGEEIERRLDPERARWVGDFASRYYEHFPLEELVGRQLTDVYGSTLGWWNQFQSRDPSNCSVEVFNPSLEDDGWIARGTVVRIVQRTMPFLIDSIRIALNRRNITIHTVHGCALEARRDHEHRVIGLGASRGPADAGLDAGSEALIYMEISRHSSVEDRQAIAREIESVIRDVELTVDDFQPMRAKLLALVEELEKQPPANVPADEAAEAREFLSWMARDHFTFLGYTEIEFSDQGGRTAVVEVDGVRLGLLRKRTRPRQMEFLNEMDQRVVSTLIEPRLLGFSKSSVRSSVHRNAYSDYVTVKRFDEQGEVRGEVRFLGLYTSSVYGTSPFEIPVVRKKLAYAMEHVSSEQGMFHRRHLEHVLESFPREELFQSSAPELYRTALGIMRIQERKQVRIFARDDPYGRFTTCLVYFPRDLYSTHLRRRAEEILCEAFGALESEFTTYFSESVNALTHFVLKLDPTRRTEYDLRNIQLQLVETSKTWEERLAEALLEAFGEETAAQLLREYEGAFPAAYQDDVEPRSAVADIRAVMGLERPDEIAMQFFRAIEEPENRLRFKLLHLDERVALSDLIPALENLGLRVAGEHPYIINRREAGRIWIHELRLDYTVAESVDLARVKENFLEAFSAIWSGKAESDGFNRMLLGTHLDWREVAMLRAYAKYTKQLGFHFSLAYIAETLSRHLAICEDLVRLFTARFDPELNRNPAEAAHSQQRIERRVLGALDAVESLDEDRILRQYLGLIHGTLRTNFFQLDEAGQPKPYFSFKLDPQQIPNVPEPRPQFEIFVYSPRVEAVHLRAGKVARGGLRWSDRLEDYRTEVLWLVKAQQVKNAVIVPVGAKGGFVVKGLPAGATREEIHAEGVECYRTFIRGMLDITDNLQGGAVVAPDRVVRKDDDDPYLVVAADKGTATFSDIANEISNEYGFWLGDGFASGGSVGYDHKKMGITARGAWVSVQQHLAERGIDVQNEDFTVVGIGDMSGDVFGNGMLLSEHIRLVAAFNHQHIFVDPEPDAAVSHRERRRLFELQRSSWSDYAAELISAGGGVFSRTSKSIEISPEMRECFDIEADQLPPNDLIAALLRAPVDLVWNGGIGTYVKARSETHADVGDKANDGVRVNAESLRCRVIAEGGNLGVTQLGRVAFCLGGGAMNTDFIDNAAGVDCSDHEVNIKILLGEIMAEQGMGEQQRRDLLEEMEEDVSKLVLANSRQQAEAISLAEATALRRVGEHRRYIASLEDSGRLDRGLEFIPEDEALVERISQGATLTRPELSLLISYSKTILKEELAATLEPHDRFLRHTVESAFPEKLRELFGERIHTHRLSREILATQLANDIVNRMGFTFPYRLHESTGADTTEIAVGYYTAREIFDLQWAWKEIDDLDGELPSSERRQRKSDLRRLVRRGTRWCLRNRRGSMNPTSEIARFRPVMMELSGMLPELLRGSLRDEWSQRHQGVVRSGGSEALATFLAGAPHLQICFALGEVAETTSASLERVAEVYFRIGEALELNWFSSQVFSLQVNNHWQALARESALDDLEWQQRALTTSVIRYMEPEEVAEKAIERWKTSQTQFAHRWTATINDLHGGAALDFAMCSVALRELLDWAHASAHP